MKIGSFELDLNALAAVITAVGALVMAVKGITKKKKDEDK